MVMMSWKVRTTEPFEVMHTQKTKNKKIHTHTKPCLRLFNTIQYYSTKSQGQENYEPTEKYITKHTHTHKYTL